MPARLLQVTGKYIGLLCVVSFVLAACAAPAASDTTGATATPTPEISGEIPVDDLLVYVPAGRFYMGSDPQLDPDAQIDEEPLHQVLLNGFFIYRNEVTNSQYKQCVAAGECSAPQIFDEGPSTHYTDPEYDEYPVVGVNWDQANAFCAWADSRLPTEAEWEKTARGEFGDVYPWGEDSPSCDTSNMDGCIVDPADTDTIGQRPDGESFYEANDMSGNVWEWTSDWYLEDYYLTSAFENPTGPQDGELRVVRGGSYEDGPEALRTAERLGLDPEQAYNNVGFRCVPLGLPSTAQAPFCQPAYVPFCVDPNGGTDCTPPAVGETPQGEGGYTFVAFGCPDAKGYVQVTVDAPDGLPDGTISVGGVTFTCSEDTATPGRYRCYGPHPAQGTITTVEICADGQQQGNVGGLVAFQPSAGSQVELVAFQPNNGGELKAFEPSQPAGLQAFNAAPPQGLVAFQAAYSNCPSGYVLNAETGQCELNPDGGCPEGTTYSPDQQGCTPDQGGDCPVGYAANDRGVCQPDGGDQGGACPAGYYFNSDISCCAPLPGDNGGCEDGSYFDTATNSCQPIDENGCREGYVYNRYEGGCVPDYGDGQTTDPSCRQPGYVMNDQGQCVPGGALTSLQTGASGNCPDGGYFDPATKECVQGGDGGQCGPGYRYDQQTESCIPTDGPGSGCGTGYAYSEQLGCCVALPGTDGSYCPGDQPQAGLTNTSFVAGPSQTGYDYGSGACTPSDDTLCPDGTYYDQRVGYCVQTYCNCELGYYFDEKTQACIPYGGQTGSNGCWTYQVSVPVCPYEQPTPDDHGCEKDENYNAQTGRCEPTTACADYSSRSGCTAGGCTWVPANIRLKITAHCE